MRIYFLSKQVDFCRSIGRKLEDEGHICAYYNQTDAFYNDIHNLIQQPDLFILDYFLFNHDIYNIYEDKIEKQNYVPLIFYNEQCPLTDSLSLHWQKITEMTALPYKELDMKAYEEVFSLLENEVKKAGLNMAQTGERKSLGQIKSGTNDEEGQKLFYEILKLKKETKMRDNLFFLLQILFEHSDTFMTAKDIFTCYKEDNKNIKLSSLKVEISQLKGILQKSITVTADIIRRNDGYKLILIPNGL